MAVWPKNYKKFFEKKNRPLKNQRTTIQIRCNLSDLNEASGTACPCGMQRYYGRAPFPCCLLYTSDAADEEDSVDLGGRRIIKKKNRENK